MDRRIVAALQGKFPRANFGDYFKFIDSCKNLNRGGCIHHIAPKSVFPKLLRSEHNKIRISVKQHFYAHYYLAIAVPRCSAFQTAFYLMACVGASKINKRQLPRFAEVYQRGMRASSRRTKIQNASPQFKSVMKNWLSKVWKDPDFVAQQSKRARATLKRIRNTPSFKSAHKKAMTRYWSNDRNRISQSKVARRVLKKLNSDPTFAARNAKRSSERMKKLHQDPTFKAALSARWVQLNADLKFKKRMAKKSSLRMKKMWSEGKLERGSNGQCIKKKTK